MPNIFTEPSIIDLSPAIAGFFIVGVLLGFPRRLDFVWRPVSTYLHEMAHAFTAILLGRKVNRIKVRFWFGGHTDYVGQRGIANGIVAWAGYAAPGLILTGMALGLSSGYLFFIITPFIVGGVLASFLQRTLTGLISGLGLSLFFIWTFLTLNNFWTQAILYLFLGIFSGHGIASVKRLTKVRLSTMQPSSTDSEIADSEFLARWTGLSALFWERTWITFIVIAIVVNILVLLTY